jgi:cell division septation protein DedD
MSRYPIESEQNTELASNTVKDVYSKLEAEPVPIDKEKELPKLGVVKSADSEPIVDALVADLLNEKIAEEAVTAPPLKEVVDAELGKDSGLDSATGKTLADLVQKGENLDQVDTNIGNNVQDNNSLDKIAEAFPEKELPTEIEKKLDSVSEQVNIASDSGIDSIALDAPTSLPSIAPSLSPSPSPLPSPKPIVKEASNFLKPKLNRGWYVQVGAPESLDEANKIASQLKDSGFPVSIEKAQVQSQTYYRLLVGPEDNRVQGERLLEQVKRERYIKAQPFLRMSR